MTTGGAVASRFLLQQVHECILLFHPLKKICLQEVPYQAADSHAFCFSNLVVTDNIERKIQKSKAAPRGEVDQIGLT
uniref:Uncharacterized protein n=1 Tax=Romanomermis culicivorax TaxID=13658 RepID=A0A915J7X4_ROMCU